MLTDGEISGKHFAVFEMENPEPGSIDITYGITGGRFVRGLLDIRLCGYPVGVSKGSERRNVAADGDSVPFG